jgi:hypothetical protein
MSDEEESERELYENALETIAAAKRERREKFPRLEALRDHYRDEFNREEDHEKRILVDMLIRDVEALFDEEKDDPIDIEE